MAASAGPECMWEGPRCALRQDSTSTKSGDTSAKRPKGPVGPFLPASTCWLPIRLVTERASGGMTQVFSESPDRVNGVHQIYIGSVSMSVQGLRPLSKNPSVYQV